MRHLAFCLLMIAAAAWAGDEVLAPDEREAILRFCPPTAAERSELRDTDVIITLTGETIRCAILGFRNDTVTLRSEGQKLNIPLSNVRRILLVQRYFDILVNRLDAIPTGDAAARYALAAEAVARAAEDPRITPWAEEVLQACVRSGAFAPACILLGDLQAAQGRYPMAEVNYARAVEMAPNDPVVLGRHAANLRRQVKYPEAERWYREALRRAPDDPDLLEGLGYVLLKRERVTEAAEFFRQALDRNPDHPLALAAYPLVLGYEGRFIEARAMLDRAAAAGALTAEAYLTMGKLALLYGRYAEAEGDFLNALRMDSRPDDPIALAHLALTYAAVGDREKARRSLEGFTREEFLADPDVANAIGFVLLRDGEALAAAGGAAEAAAAYGQARDAFLKGLGPSETNYYALYGIGIANLRLGNEREGLSTLGRAGEARPRFAEARLAAAEYFLAGGQAAVALKEYDRLMQRSVPVLMQDRAGLPDAAADNAAGEIKALRKGCNDLLIRIHVGRVRALAALDRIEDARQAAAAALAAVPGRPEPYEYLGYAAFATGDEDRAREQFAAGKDLGSSYCQRCYQALLLARNQDEQVDDFNREASLTLRNSWEETERAGIDISIQDGKMLMAGTVTKAWAQSYGSRIYRAATFVSAGVTVTPDPAAGECFTGIFILGQKSGRGIFLIRNDKDRLCFGSSDRQEEGKDWKWSDLAPWPGPGPVTIAIKQVDKAMRKFDLLVNDKKVQTLLSGSLVKEDAFRVGCFVQGRDGVRIQVIWDDFRAITEKVD